MLRIIRCNLKQIKITHQKTSFLNSFNISTRNFSENSSNSQENLLNNTLNNNENILPTTTTTTTITTNTSNLPINPATSGGSYDYIPADYHPFNLLGQLIDNVHHTLDIPYWGSIMLCTVAVRILLFPTTVLQSQNTRRAQKVGEESKKIQSLYPMELLKSDPTKQKEFQEKILKLYADYGFVPSRTLIYALFPVPVFLSFFFGLQKMPETYPEFATGGTLFFENLGAIDPYYILPALNGALFIAMIELNPEIKKKPAMHWGMRGLGIFIGGVSCQFPAAVTLYWCTSNLFTLFQSQILTNPEFLKATAPVFPKDLKKDDNSTPA